MICLSYWIVFLAPRSTPLLARVRSGPSAVDAEGIVVEVNDLSSYSTATAVNTAITTALASYTTTAALIILLNAKQAALTASTGIFLNGATISSYGLRWNTNSTPTLTIDDLHFDGYMVTETLNLSTNKVELKVGAPTDMATQTWASTQLATKQSSITADLNVPGELTLSTSSATSGYGLPIWSFHDSITNYMAFGFTVTALGNNNQRH